MRTKLVLVIALVFQASLVFCAEMPQLSIPEKSFSFGKVVQGTKVEHTFVIRNEGKDLLRIEKVSMTPPLRMGETPVAIGPGQAANLPLVLDTSNLKGEFEAIVLLTFNDPLVPQIELGFAGRVVESVEIFPRSIFVLGAPRGEARETSLEIINHEPQPLRILAIEHSKERFTTRLQTVEDGQHYKLWLKLNPNGPSGKHVDTVVVKTTSGAFPELKIKAATWLKERVYTFPDEIDLGTLRLAQIKAQPDLLKGTAQTLMVYQWGGADFRVKLRTDLPMLDLKLERGPKGDRYQATITLIGEKLQSGQIKGSIIVETNDPEFPSLAVPVTGLILVP